MKHIIICLLLIGLVAPVFGQQIPNRPPTAVEEGQARAELEKMGLEEAEVREALLAEGIDIDNPQDMTPDQIIRFQEIIKELQEEKAERGELQLDKDGMVIDSIPEEEIDNIPRDLTQIEPDSLLELDLDSLMLDSIKNTLIYGHYIFKTGNVDIFKQSLEVSAPDSYIIGSGDEITVSIFGRSQVEEKHEVRPDGYIRILDGRARLLMRGIALGQAKDKLFRAYRENYRFSEGEFEVTVNQSRTVRVNMTGELENPGTVTLSGMNSVFNALISVKGPTEIGSVRKIVLIKRTGAAKQFDVYKYLQDPNTEDDFFLEDNDAIHIPAQGKVVSIIGEVKRPMRYELLDNEGINELLKYAGGLTPKAYRTTFRVTRYENDERVVSDIPYLELLRSRSNYTLMDGDEIVVNMIESDPRNFVSVLGEVHNPGEFEKTGGMTVHDLIVLARLKPESKTDAAFLQSNNVDGTISYRNINLDNVLRDRSSADNIVLEDRDQLIIWSKERFSDAMFVSIRGAIREEGQIPYNRSQNLKVSDLILVGGGLSRDADNIAILQRADPMIPNEMQYITLKLNEIFNDENSAENVLLEPFDDIRILSKNVYDEETFVTVQGAVNSPGSFVYGTEMTIEDALTLANGFQLAAATNNIELSRLVIEDNKPTRTVIANLSLERNFNDNGGENSGWVLQPYDILSVRYVPEFELQQNVVIRGEVISPGPYSIINDNEQISSIIERAGGLTKEAFTAGAKLYRAQDSIKYIVMRLDEVMKDKNSIYNYIVKDGDTITIPKQREFVVIKGATRIKEVLSDDIIGQDSTVRVAFHPGKDAKWYIDNQAGGISNEGRRNKIFVEHPNGEISQTKRFLFWYKYPEVRKGSKIIVGVEPPQTIEDREKEDVNWTKILGDSVAQVTSILTLILLVQRLD